MNRDDFLKLIAETGYNVGFGAKKHFATYDIVNKGPGFINFFSLAFGVYALVVDELTVKFLSATLIVFGVVGLYISFYDAKKALYEQSAIKLTQIFNDLHRLYSISKTSPDDEIPVLLQELRNIEDRYYSECISSQILFSDWYAHYKFFWQYQIEWIDEQKKFKFLRDKVPLSFSLAVVIITILIVCLSLREDIYNRNENQFSMREMSAEDVNVAMLSYCPQNKQCVICWSIDKK